jgi:hypothetical protein
MADIQEIVLKNIMVASTTDSTISRLWMQKMAAEAKVISKQGICWILEDGLRNIKVPKKTRIPAGRFRLKPTRSSKFYEIYRKDPNLKLKYILTIIEVPQFDLIRVHAGEDVEDTAGCPLTGLCTGMDAQSNFTVNRSREALKRIHNHLDVYFDEAKMDFSVPVYWENIRTPLIDHIQ